tara:strand:+ start:5735 stop:7051 length:1317 start_codon:yes stop_codon:yes gene_type:complete
MANTKVVGAKNLGGDGVLYTDRRDFYIKPNVVKELWTDVTPFTTVIANQSTMSGLADPLFKMFEHKNPWVKQQFAIDTAVAANAWGGSGVAAASNVKSANISVSAAEGIQLGANLVGLELEIMSAAHAPKFRCFVAAATATTMSVVALDNVATSAFAATDYAMIIGSAFGEGTGSPEAWSDDISVVYNSTQIFKTPLEITGTLLETSLRGESKELARIRAMKSQEHKIQKERAFLFGSNPKGISGGFADLEALTDSAGNTVRTTMGIVSALKQYGNSTAASYEQNVFASTALADYSSFVDAMEKVFQYVPTAGSKRCFVGAGALGYFSKLGGSAGFASDSGWNVGLDSMQRDSLGFNYRNLDTPHGQLQLIPTPALRGPYNKHMLMVSDENLFHAQYRAPQFQAGIQANDYDGVKDQYMSDEGVGISQLESHALMVAP